MNRIAPSRNRLAMMAVCATLAVPMANLPRVVQVDRVGDGKRTTARDTMPGEPRSAASMVDLAARRRRSRNTHPGKRRGRW